MTPLQIAQIVSNAVSQALTHQMQQIGNSPPSATAANHVTPNTTAAQQFQTPIKFDLPVFEGDSMYVCMVIAYSRVWINRVRLPILLVVS